MSMPFERSLQIVGLASDPHAVAEEWAKEIENAKKFEIEKLAAKKKNKNNDDNGDSNNIN